MNKQFISKFAAFAAVVAVSGGILVTQSCKKNEDLATEIKVEDSEDTEKTKTDIGVAEITEKYAYMTGKYQDSVNYELGILQAKYDHINDTITKVLVAKATVLKGQEKAELDNLILKLNSEQDRANGKLQFDQTLKFALDNQNLNLSEEEKMMLIRLASQEDILKGQILMTKRDSAQNAVTINAYGLQIAKANATLADELAKATQEMQTKITAEEALTKTQLLNLQNSIQAIILDSIYNLSAISQQLYDQDAQIVANQKDSIAAEYSLMYKSIDQLNRYITDTAKSNMQTEVDLDDTQKELLFRLLVRTNDQSIAMFKEAERVKTDLLNEKLSAEKSFDIAQKAYDDYKESKATLVALEKTELTVVLFSVDSQGNSVLLTSDATVTLDGEVVALTNGMGIALGDLEGNHFVTVTAANHLKTSFTFTIDEVNTNDNADNFTLYKKRLEVKLLKANESFTISGTVKANITTHEFYALGNGYDYLQVADLFDVVTDADLFTSIQNAMDKRDNENGTLENIVGKKVNIKVSPQGVTTSTYIGGDVSNISNFNMENTVAITATTGADGSYVLTNVPVLNDEFKVEVVLENSRYDQSYIFHGQNIANEEMTKTVKYDTQVVNNRSVTVGINDRIDGTVYFQDFVLFN